MQYVAEKLVLTPGTMTENNQQMFFNRRMRMRMISSSNFQKRSFRINNWRTIMRI